MENENKDVVKYQLGWVFTVEEEIRMKKAIKEASKFMETYGKGRKPKSTSSNMLNRHMYS
jgi:hypothetical protein